MPRNESEATPDYESLLLNLLAVIHRDGGHHVGATGVEQACADAHFKITGMWTWAETEWEEKQVLQRRIAALEGDSEKRNPNPLETRSDIEKAWVGQLITQRDEARALAELYARRTASLRHSLARLPNLPWD